MIQTEFPIEFRSFLIEANGLNIFSDSLCIGGRRTSYVRSGDESIQPYDLLLMNEEKFRECPKTWICFGGYSWDGSDLLLDTEGKVSSKVYRCKRYSNIIIQEWSSFTEWLTEEVDRLSELFDSEGKPYDEDVPTVPSIE